MTWTIADLNPYVALILVGFLPNEIWRWLGMIFARRIDESSEIVVWVRAVAVAILAGVIAQILISPPGALATVPDVVRYGAAVVGFAVYLAARKSVFAGVVAGEIVVFAGKWWLG